jgi:hypothetical protein
MHIIFVDVHVARNTRLLGAPCTLPLPMEVEAGVYILKKEKKSFISTIM